MKAQLRVRPRLVQLINEATEKKRIAQEKAEVDTRLRLELAAFNALPDSDKTGVTIRVAKYM